MTKPLRKMIENINHIIENNVFCTSAPGGEGYHEKSMCSCYQSAYSEKCQAKLDKEFFHSRFDLIEGMSEDLSYNEKMRLVVEHRQSIIDNLPEDLKNRQWFKDNVKGE